MTKQEIYDRFSFLEGLVREDTYQRGEQGEVTAEWCADIPGVAADTINYLTQKIDEQGREIHRAWALMKNVRVDEAYVVLSALVGWDATEAAPLASHNEAPATPKAEPIAWAVVYRDGTLATKDGVFTDKEKAQQCCDYMGASFSDMYPPIIKPLFYKEISK